MIHDGRSEARFLKYTEYLQTDHWQIVRNAALILGYHMCAHCGSAFQLNVHHANYKHLWYEQVRDLIVLCWTCHGIEHKLHV